MNVVVLFFFSFSSQDAHVFNDFIDSNALYEVPLGGLKFTWRTKDGNKLSKLDRFFITNNILKVVNDLKGSVLPRGYPDHAPILLFQDKLDFGPRYFKIFESWFARPDFDEKVCSAWKTLNNDHNMDIVVKFQLMKQELKGWIISSRSNEATRLKGIVNKINDLDVVIDAGNADADLINLRNSLFAERDDIYKLEALDSLQKSRIKWDMEGDENSQFFHNSLKHKRGMQQIHGLMVDGCWIDNPNAIKNIFFEFYKLKFNEVKTGAEFNYIEPRYKLTRDEACFLERDLDDMEIKNAVWYVRRFFVTSFMPRSANSAFFLAHSEGAEPGSHYRFSANFFD
ncbi:uncharacterized protein [Rutidosis leptorrhynchoides]|uniref:uncharacterized protein n=1 Tax=Rutidosis leptorrhynchoides TaxID=125765 RepID=UPI003A98E68E